MKEYLVQYHLGEGVIAERIINGDNPGNISSLTPGAKYSFDGLEGIYYSFQSSDVKMVTVKEKKKAVIQKKPGHL